MTKLQTWLGSSPGARWTVLCVRASDKPSLAAVRAALEQAPAAPSAQRRFDRALHDRQELRIAVVGTDRDDALAQLTDRLEGAIEPSLRRDPPPVAFMFTGQGSQAVGMGQGLTANARFRAHLQRWCELLSRPWEPQLLAAMHGDEASEAELANTWNAQRALFALEVSLAALWIEAGVRPRAVIGHSIGELAAAYVAEVMTADHAAALVRARASLMGQLPRGGAMVAVRAPEHEVRKRIAPAVSIAAVNGAKNTVIPGAEADVQRAQEALEAAGFACQPLNVSHPFHSLAMDPMLGPLRDAAAPLAFAAPRIPLASNVSGELLTEAPGPAYWADHVRGTVRYAQGLQTLQSSGFGVFLEIGPSPVLKRLGGRGRSAGCTWLSSFEPPNDEQESILAAGAALFEQGVEIDWRVLLGAP